MRTNNYLLIPLLIIGTLNINISAAAAEEKENKRMIETFQGFSKSTKHERAQVLREVKENKIKVSDEAKTTLIDAFEKESLSRQEYTRKLKEQGLSENVARQKSYRELGGKEYVRYYGDFAALISSFKDIRTIPSLLRGLNDYGGTVVPTQIIAIGEDAVGPLITASQSSDSVMKRMSIFVLSIWVNAPLVTEDYVVNENMSIKDQKLINKIKIVLVEALHDSDVDVRSRAIFGLGAFPDETVIKELEKAAINDPYYSEYEKGYPLRDDAKKSIEKIKAKLK